jgi:hypothetical protein
MSLSQKYKPLKKHVMLSVVETPVCQTKRFFNKLRMTQNVNF